MLGEGIGSLDLDYCIGVTGALAPWAQEFVDEHREDALLIEVSQSGRRREGARGAVGWKGTRRTRAATSLSPGIPAHARSASNDTWRETPACGTVQYTRCVLGATHHTTHSYAPQWKGSER